MLQINRLTFIVFTDSNIRSSRRSTTSQIIRGSFLKPITRLSPAPFAGTSCTRYLLISFSCLYRSSLSLEDITPEFLLSKNTKSSLYLLFIPLMFTVNTEVIEFCFEFKASKSYLRFRDRLFSNWCFGRFFPKWLQGGQRVPGILPFYTS